MKRVDFNDIFHLFQECANLENKNKTLTILLDSLSINCSFSRCIFENLELRTVEVDFFFVILFNSQVSHLDLLEGMLLPPFSNSRTNQ